MCPNIGLCFPWINAYSTRRYKRVKPISTNTAPLAIPSLVNTCMPLNDKIPWRHQMETFSALLAICAGNYWSPVNSPHKGHWRGALMFSLICVWIIGWGNNREAGDLRRNRANYDVTVMIIMWAVITEYCNDELTLFRAKRRSFGGSLRNVWLWLPSRLYLATTTTCMADRDTDDRVFVFKSLVLQAQEYKYVWPYVYMFLSACRYGYTHVSVHGSIYLNTPYGCVYNIDVILFMTIKCNKPKFMHMCNLINVAGITDKFVTGRHI